jgi:RNase P/RNase MRP subunit POP5
MRECGLGQVDRLSGFASPVAEAAAMRNGRMSSDQWELVLAKYALVRQDGVILAVRRTAHAILAALT